MGFLLRLAPLSHSLTFLVLFFFPSPAICLVHSVWRQVEYLPSSLKCGMGLLQFVLLQV